MEGQLIPLVTSILSIIISVFTILGILSRFSNGLFSKAARKAVESIKFEDLDPRSEIHGTMKKVKELSEMCDLVKGESKTQKESLQKIEESLETISKELSESKRDRFKSDLRSRLEYTITKKGNVDQSYWDHIAEDYTYYTDVLKMNTYMGSLYREAEKLYIKVNVKRESTK